MCPAVKADAYGHGAVTVARRLEDWGADMLGIATVEEGAELRRAGVKIPLLLLGLSVPEEIPEIVAWDLTPVVCDAEYVEALDSAARMKKKVLKVHLKVDLGMGRLGCQPSETPALAKKIVHAVHLEWEGLCTHFPASDNGRREPTAGQVRAFIEVVRTLKEAGFQAPIVHAANSGAILDFPESHFNMVRPGIVLYGYPSSASAQERTAFRPVMELRSRISFLRRLPAGSSLSYGMTYILEKESWVATVPAGYGDGYSRLLSGKAPVRVGGRIFLVSGRICMDQFMIDLGSEAPPCRRWDDVILFGPEGPTARDLAELMGTIPYEITCMVSRRVPRVYVE